MLLSAGGGVEGGATSTTAGVVADGGSVGTALAEEVALASLQPLRTISTLPPTMASFRLEVIAPRCAPTLSLAIGCWCAMYGQLVYLR